MRQPFWIVNSILLLEFLVVTYYTFFRPLHLPSVKAIRPIAQTPPPTAEPTNHDFSAIYTNDLFGTESLIYRGQSAAELETSNFPLPPELPEPEAPLPPQPHFLAPLNITLTGIMTFGNHLENIAIILDNQTKTEVNYRIGDNLQDAQVIDINKHKVELIRANGQQETLYLYQREAQAELAKNTPAWHKCIQQLDGQNFKIDLSEFKQQAQSLGHLIELLGLTTAYQNGENLGCRVGQAGHQSLGAALGLQTGDILLAIADIPTKSTQERYQIYHKLSTLAASLEQDSDDDTAPPATRKFEVQLLRHGQELVLNYAVSDEEHTPPAPLARRLIPTSTALTEAEFSLPDQPHELKRSDFMGAPTRTAQLPAESLLVPTEHNADQPEKYADTVQKLQQRTQQQLQRAAATGAVDAAR